MKTNIKVIIRILTAIADILWLLRSEDPTNPVWLNVSKILVQATSELREELGKL